MGLIDYAVKLFPTTGSGC